MYQERPKIDTYGFGVCFAIFIMKDNAKHALKILTFSVYR